MRLRRDAPRIRLVSGDSTANHLPLLHTKNSSVQLVVGVKVRLAVEKLLILASLSSIPRGYGHGSTGYRREAHDLGPSA